MLRNGCRGRYDLLDELWSEVVLERVPRIYVLHGDNPSKVANSLRWYVFKYMNKRYDDETPCSNLPEPSYTVEHEDKDEVQYILDSLDPYDASLLELYFMYELTYQEIADEIDVSKSTAMNHVKAALERARDHFADR